jgi:hypothetical protein
VAPAKNNWKRIPSMVMTKLAQMRVMALLNLQVHSIRKR